jgi:hypothetical protein
LEEGTGLKSYPFSGSVWLFTGHLVDESELIRHGRSDGEGIGVGLVGWLTFTAILPTEALLFDLK